jgi:ribosomal protein S18 acetylase RimI-like enzyme
MIRRRLPRRDDPRIYHMIVHELVPFTHSGYCPTIHSFAAIRKRLRSNVTFVDEHPSYRLCGFISIQVRADVLFIDLLAVDPIVRGRGIGKSLMLTSQRYGQRTGCRESRLFVDQSNQHALGFYRAMGYGFLDYYAQIRCYLLSKRLS